jgi:quercetin dioxygenase-like cupin family protein
MSKINREKVAANWAERGFGCDLWVDPPGRRWSNFTHSTDELVMLLEGEMEFTVENEVIRPRIGEELLIPARSTHSAHNIGSSTARWLYGYKQE